MLSIVGVALVIEHIVNLRQDKIAPPDLYAQLFFFIETATTERACRCRVT